MIAPFSRTEDVQPARRIDMVVDHLSTLPAVATEIVDPLTGRQVDVLGRLASFHDRRNEQIVTNIQASTQLVKCGSSG